MYIRKEIMKNFIFISPHFPSTYYRFVTALKNNGFRVLGIGDSPYFDLPEQLRNDLTEYYLCPNMDDFQNEVNAVQYFQDKYGHIDYLESNNEYWLDKDARLREIFNIDTGIQGDEIKNYQYKSIMKQFYEKAHCPTAKWILVEDKEQVLNFISKVGYPIFIKPDKGVGAVGNYKIENIEDLNYFFENKSPNITYICEQFLSGELISFDGIANSNSDVIFCDCEHFPPSIADIVHFNKDVFYYTLPSIPQDLEELGRNIIKAFGVKKRYFHLEFFRLDRDIEGVGKKGSLCGLEVNMRPPGGYTPDLINFASSVDTYQIWADVMMFDEDRHPSHYEHYYAGCYGRRDDTVYLYSQDEIITKYHNSLCAYGRYPLILATDLGNTFYMAKFKTLDEVIEFSQYVGETK